MLFRDHEGNLVEINRLNYKTDAIYYKKIESIRMGMGGNRNPKVNGGGGSVERIMSLVEKCKTEN